MAKTAYSHKNSKGKTYYLHKKAVPLRGGKLQEVYFFIDHTRQSDAVEKLPKFLEIQENPRNGYLSLKRVSERHDEDDE